VGFVVDKVALGHVSHQILRVLGAFAKFPKAAIGFIISIRPPVRLSALNISDPTGQIFMKFDI
jgi:hypothetical protein